MATDKYIHINGTLANFAYSGEVMEGDFSTSAPSTLNFAIRKPYTDPEPIVGNSVELFTRVGVKIFGGVIYEVDWAGLDEVSEYITYSIKSRGYDDRMYRRTTWNRATFRSAKYQSYSGVMDVAGTVGTWVSGDKFSTDLASKTVIINGANRVVTSSVTSPDELSVTTSMGTHSSVAWNYTLYCGDVAKDLLDNYCDFEGFTYTGTSIQQGVAITKIVFDPPIPVNEALGQLRDANDNFYLAVDPNQVVYFAVRSLVAAPANLVSNGSSIIGWKRNVNAAETTEDVRNTEISITTWEAIAGVAESFVGDGVSKAWFLSDYIQQLVVATLNGVAVTITDGEVVGASADFYFRGFDKAIWQDPAGVTLTSGDTLEVTYKKYGSNLIEFTDDTSRAARATVEGSGFGRYEQVIDRTDLSGKTDALTISTASVNNFKENFNTITIETTDVGYMVGQYLNIHITDRNINLNLFIDEVAITDAECQGGTYDFVYTLTCVSISRRITGVDALRSLFSNNGGGGGGTFGTGGGGGGGGGSFGPVVTKLMLTGPLTVMSPGAPAFDGQLWVVKIEQDATGGRVVTWGSDTHYPPRITSAALPSTMVVVVFVGLGTDWYNQPLLGVPNA